MARMEIVEGRDAGSRFALNYSQRITTELFRYADERKPLKNELRSCSESYYWDFYQESMNGAGGARGRRFNFDFVIEEQSRLIKPGLSSGKWISRNIDHNLQEEKIYILRAVVELFWFYSYIIYILTSHHPTVFVLNLLEIEFTSDQSFRRLING